MNYRITKSRNRATAANERYVAKVCHNNVIDFEDFIEEIQASTTLTTSDLRGTVDALGYALMRHLQQGDVVDLPHIGRFKIEMECTPVDNQEDFRIDKHFKRFQLHVIPYSHNGSQPLYDSIKLERM